MSPSSSVRPPIPAPEELAELPPDGGPRWNRLVFESSPYLLQHAANPVDWRPWGDDAFAAARAADKPLFLSIGYAACHWCHVMEHESFEDEDVARLLNESFVCVKVDKEERPDIDDIYMTVCQAMTGHGGWPMTVVLDHDKKPFFAGTYFPKEGLQGRPGMMQLIPAIARAWREDRDKIRDSAAEITAHIRQVSGCAPGGDLTENAMRRAAEQLAARFDRYNGGFGERPKFPTPHNYLFLLRWARRAGDEQALAMTRFSLERMRLGGIFDHVGFGFHRYSTDERWLLPHFEKMLYDQALLAMAYLEAYAETKQDSFARTAREIFEYVLRDLTGPEGGFYSAEDADSEGEEGKFYVWTLKQVEAALGEDDRIFYCKFFQFRSGGNFRDEASGQRSGLNIPHLDQDLDESAEFHGVEASEFREVFEEMRLRLFAEREKRERPLKDDKVLADWNGLMIAAFAMGARILGEPDYLKAAERAADFLFDQVRDERGRLLKRWRLGQAGLPAQLDDYAFVIWGLIELHQASQDPRFLARAVTLCEQAIAHFRDEGSGAFFFSPDDGESLIMRSMRAYDGAVPAGNSAMALNLAKLARLTGQARYEDYARQVLRAFAGQLEPHPQTATLMLCALEFMLGPAFEVVIAGEPDDPGTHALLAAAHGEPLANKVVLWRREDNAEALAELAPFTAAQVPKDGRPTAYVCRNFVCDAPIHDPDALRATLESRS